MGRVKRALPDPENFTMRAFLLPGLALALAAGLPCVSLAQPAQSYPGQGYPPTQGAPGQGYANPPYQSQPRQGQAANGEAGQRLHDALRLTPDQEDAWRAYQTSIAPNAQQMARARQAQMMLPNLPTPRRLALMKAEMQSDMAAFDRNAQAVVAFYDSLTPEQQRIFDAETAHASQQQGR
jgi:hypothetical protein